MVLCTLQSATSAHRTRWVKQKILTRREYFASDLYVNCLPPRFLIHFGRPMAENYESVFLTGVRPKPGFGPFVGRLWVKFSKFWRGETLDLDSNGPESFSPGFFTYFGRSTAKNYDSVFLTTVRPNGVFHWRATKTRVRSFWPSCDYFPILVLLTDGATNRRLILRKFRSFVKRFSSNFWENFIQFLRILVTIIKE